MKQINYKKKFQQYKPKKILMTYLSVIKKQMQMDQILEQNIKNDLADHQTIWHNINDSITIIGLKINFLGNVNI